MVQLIFDMIRRWGWLLVLTTAIAGVASYMIAQEQPDVYRAKALLLVGASTTSPNPTRNDLEAAGQLTETYAALATTRPTLEAIIEELGLDMTPDELQDMITIVTTPQTQILTVQVLDTDPDLALAVAQAMVGRLRALSPASTADPDNQFREQIADQIQRLEERIASSEELIAELEASLQTATTREERMVIVNDILQEQNRLSDSEQFLMSLYQTFQAPATNRIEVVEPPTQVRAVSSRTLIRVFISMAAGFVLGISIVAAFQYLDDTIHDEAALEGLDVELLGAVQRRRRANRQGAERLVVHRSPEAETPGTRAYKAAESYRLLASRLVYSLGFVAPIKEQINTVVLAGTSHGSDVSEIAANLAIVISQLGIDVVLVDANLYHPALDDIFEIPASPGLTDALKNSDQAVEPAPVQGSDHLRVVAVGSQTDAPFEVLASESLAALLDQWMESGSLVLIAAPAMDTSASRILGARVKASILVVFADQSRRVQIQHAMTTLGNVIGTIFVQKPGRRFWLF